MATRGVANPIAESAEFGKFAKVSFARYLNADWGEMCESGKQQNEDALKNNRNRIFASCENAEHPAWKLWIITEWDHSATTLLFPSEY